MKKLILFLCFMFVCGIVTADDFSVIKPPISDTKILTKEEQQQVKDALTKQGKILIFNDLTPAKNDYNNDFDRGTVYFNPEKGNNMLGRKVFNVSNYSFHKVIIPNGSVVNEVNFSQKNPHTVAIQGKNLHFINCNLTNVELDPTWTFEGGLRIQSRESVLKENGNTYLIQEIEKDGKWIENSRIDITDTGFTPN